MGVFYINIFKPIFGVEHKEKSYNGKISWLLLTNTSVVRRCLIAAEVEHAHCCSMGRTGLLFYFSFFYALTCLLKGHKRGIYVYFTYLPYKKGGGEGLS